MADKEVRLIDACKIETFLRQMRYATATHGMDYDVEIVSIILETVEHEPTIEAQSVKYDKWIDYEKLIGIFGTLCDHMVDNGRCDVFCPYADTKDANDECKAWRTIQKFRREDGDSE